MFPPLVLRTEEHCLRVRGGTFEYVLDANTGLLKSARVREVEWLAGFLPDLWASPEVDPRAQPYHARYTPYARATVTSHSDRQVEIETGGQFARVDGCTLPLHYQLNYVFEIDGTVKVTVRVQADEPLTLRWLTLAQAPVSSNALQFLAYEGDQSQGASTCRPTSIAADEKISVGGSFIPWFHFGNDHSGLELVFPHSHASYGWTDSSPYTTGDPLGSARELFTLQTDRGTPQCTAFALRNLRETLSPGKGYEETFYISAVPGRLYRPEAGALQVQWIGPHQYRSGWRAPDDQDVQKWAESGVNTVVGGANWYSGDYARCWSADDTERFIETCHNHGLRVLPYITFTDMEYGAEAFEEHGPNWRIEPVTEFNYRSHLMCYGAEGWQEHWQNQLEQAFDQFAFDGLYIDFWAGRLICRNARHGCTGPYGRFTIAGLRRMARYANELVAARSSEGLILANTNILPLAMINNWVDARLYGEWHNLEQTDPLAMRVFYNSHRFGTGSVLLVRRVPHITEKTLALAALFQGNGVLSHARSEDERCLLQRQALLHTAFGTEQAQALNHFELSGELVVSNSTKPPPALSVFYRPDLQEWLIAVSTFGQSGGQFSLSQLLEKATQQQPIAKPTTKAYYFYVCETQELIGSQALLASEWSEQVVELPPDALRHMWIKPASDSPTPLYALSNASRPKTNWIPTDKLMELHIPSKARMTAETVILGPSPKRVEAEGTVLPFETRAGWWTAQLPCNTRIRVLY